MLKSPFTNYFIEKYCFNMVLILSPPGSPIKKVYARQSRSWQFVEEELKGNHGWKRGYWELKFQRKLNLMV